ncbi:MAG: DNA repair protein RecO [Candidatus Omnitrophica bacterium]|nr:DNA repair protein RecO [Candidatus Omnitrophota bacterium]
MIRKAEALVLKRCEFRETSFILTLFTKDFGKINGLAKGVRVSPPKWRTSFPLFSYNTVVFYPRRGLNLITDAELLKDFGEKFSILNRHIFASYLVELIDLFMPLEEKNERIFEMLLKIFTLIGDAEDLERIVRIFEIKLLQLTGFSPRIDNCIRCKKPIIKSAYFSHRNGGLLCKHCALEDGNSSFIQPGTISTLKHILSGSEENLFSRLRMGRLIREELRLVLEKFLVYHLERVPRAYELAPKA